jgi:hypothetical protein
VSGSRIEPETLWRPGELGGALDFEPSLHLFALYSRAPSERGFN